MRALIVDDEALARSKLLRMLRVFPDVEVVGEAIDGASALTLAEQLRPDVIFLDVQMPEVDGFDVAASLPDDAPALVFVTAFDQYALRAFDAQAVDYLLKPVEPERLARTVQRLRASVRVTPRPSVGVPAQLMIVDRGQTHIVRCAEIEWLEAADNYVNIHLPGRSLLMRRTLTALLNDLDPMFVRTHRGAAVALAAVLAVRPEGKGDATIVLRSGAEVPCSRQHRAALMQRLQR
ncbi:MULTISPECIES: LytTR family DNA-binding domain-containing protein [Paraburkholderia]|uniref:LytR/AlgR family response regulator transcription factor n=1 Tax=Paraburkholderia TaxID=1822464 RepID=UPI00225B63A1|nr:MULTISPECIES: response regulator [Paraburkholderia]MCX4160899.1 response regulator [Paraburkholderia megapolitana]MDN7156395.1 response regulator [Paraburkholderia sp. CHISQ3]MDQ6493440.1 response regulator [Paraburkholderia megapolitana]